METLKANFLILLFFVALAGVGYWAVNSLQVKPEEFDARERDIRPVVVNEPTGGFTQSPSEEVVEETPVVTKPTTPTEEPNPDTSIYGDLKTALQKLVNDNVLMKKGSRGTRVGTVQEFLNIYNGTDSKIDNDYGTTTENQIKVFQKAEGITADGEAGPGTYKKMIDWLNKQN
ncbi:MAG: N-acetylmuramoyl-L-alanine amidase [Patescibacteria group bacterium]|nr:N-acetylmuramoyl-L-alanine amidase [Patescibacteria group bacterium]